VTSWERIITRVYRVLLACYPSLFRSEFGEEMQDVFAAALLEGQHPGGKQHWWLISREIRDWPRSVLQAHQGARRRKMLSKGFIDEKPLKRGEMLTALIIFLLPLFSIFTITDNNLPQWMGILVVILFWGVILFALGLAIRKRLPRWSLSYLGFVLMPGVVLSLSPRFGGWLYPYFIQSFGSRSSWSLLIRIIYVEVFEFLMLFSILLVALILVNLLRLLPHTRGVWERIRADWTQLSFMLFGGLVFDIMLLFEEYRYEELWRFMAWLCLALGAWLYLRAAGQKQRILALIGGATGAMWIVALAKWVLVPLQKWPTGYPVAPSEASRWIETSSALFGWIWILIMLIAPALLNLLPSSSHPEHQDEIVPA